MSEGWIEVQKSTFTNWVNVQLKEGGYEPLPDNGVVEGLRDGVKLVQCLEVASKKSLGKYSKNPRMKVHKLENISRALDFVKNDEGLLIVNIGAGDIEEGNEKIVLGLIWTIIYHYQIKPALQAQASVMATKKGGAKDLLLQWVQEQIPEYNIKNLNKDWNDGRALCALVNKIAGEPWVLPNHREMLPQSAKRNAATGIDAATQHLGIPQILDPEDVINPNLDDLSMMTYISYFKDAKRVDASSGDDDSEAKAKAEQEAREKAEQEAREKAEQEAREKAEQEAREKAEREAAEASKKVALPPPWERAADWRVYEGEDLGGRCKIRVYSSTTTSSAATRKNNETMQMLFERMNVHKRPDFEPWVMVDLMSKEERDKVFAKAGTRSLPMLFVDDEFVGSYDTVMELNESNELSKILEY